MIFPSADLFWVGRRFLISICCIFISPLVFARNLSGLRYASFASLVFIGFAMSLAFFYACSLNLPDCISEKGIQDFHCKGSVVLASSLPSTARVFPIFIFSFTCQQNIFAVCNEMQHSSSKKMDQVIWTSIFGSMAVYIIFSVSGYLTFGNAVHSDVFESYDNSVLVTVARILIAVMVLLSYPLQAHPCRASLLTLYKGFQRERFNHYLFSLCILTVSYLLAISIEDLGVVQSVIGATGSATVSYILPGLVYYKIHQRQNKSGFKTYLAFFQFLIGIILVPFCLTEIFLT